jgi:hypothetical protein
MGRPRRFEEPATEAVRIRITPRQKRQLEQVARENRTDLSGAIRDAVESFVADYRDGDRVFTEPAREFRGTKLAS